MGLFGKAFDKIKDRFDGDDDKDKQEKAAQEQPKPWSNEYANQGQTTDAAATSAPTSTDTGTTASGSFASESAPSTDQPTVNTTAAEAQSDHGTVIGSGLERVYVTREGDTLEAIGAYFYGDPVQAQRLLDDNPEMNLRQYGEKLPGGLRIKAGEDAARGDFIPGSNA